MVLSTGSLQTLVLCHCKLESSIRYNVKLPFLRKLHLLHFVVDDDLINDLVTKSPLIEDICICICEYKSIKFSYPNLKSLLIKNCPSLDEVNIKTPQLSEFSYYGKIITVHLNGLALTKCTFDFWNPKDSNPNFQAIWLEFHGSFPSDYEVCWKYSTMLRYLCLYFYVRCNQVVYLYTLEILIFLPFFVDCNCSTRMETKPTFSISWSRAFELHHTDRM